MHPLNTLIFESACTIANKIRAKALLVYADVIQDYPIPSGMLDQTDVILVTHYDRATEPSAEIQTILRLPPIPLTRMAQIKLAVVIGLSEGWVTAGDKIVWEAIISAFCKKCGRSWTPGRSCCNCHWAARKPFGASST